MDRHLIRGGPTPLRVGTSGWSFRFWDRTGLYTSSDGKKIRGTAQLPHYAQGGLNAVELNSSFYRVAPESTWKSWRKRARAIGGGFVFAVKMNRRATHQKLLLDPQEWWPPFWDRAKLLEETLGPILFQFPPRFAMTPENLGRLEALGGVLPRGQPFVFEFRHGSWQREELLPICAPRGWTVAVTHVNNRAAPWAKRKSAWTQLPSGWNDMGITGTVGYVRVHGTQAQYSGAYQGHEAAQRLVERTSALLKNGVPTYVMFNNTDTVVREKGHAGTMPAAISDARLLLRALDPQRDFDRGLLLLDEASPALHRCPAGRDTTAPQATHSSGLDDAGVPGPVQHTTSRADIRKIRAIEDIRKTRAIERVA